MVRGTVTSQLQLLGRLPSSIAKAIFLDFRAYRELITSLKVVYLWGEILRKHDSRIERQVDQRTGYVLLNSFDLACSLLAILSHV